MSVEYFRTGDNEECLMLQMCFCILTVSRLFFILLSLAFLWAISCWGICACSLSYRWACCVIMTTSHMEDSYMKLESWRSWLCLLSAGGFEDWFTCSPRWDHSSDCQHHQLTTNTRWPQVVISCNHVIIGCVRNKSSLFLFREVIFFWDDLTLLLILYCCY